MNEVRSVKLWLCPPSRYRVSGRSSRGAIVCRPIYRLMVSAMLGVLLYIAPTAAEEIPGRVTVRVLKEIVDAGPRFIGLPGHERTAQMIERRLQALQASNDAAQLVIRHMKQVVPVAESAWLTMGDGQKFAIFPFWPNGARLCTTPIEGIAGPLIYLGDGHERDIPAKSLNGAIVAMEYNSYDRWKDVMRFGVRAILFLRPQRTTWVHSLAKFVNIPFDAPRFYIDDEELAQSIRDQADPREVRIVSRMKWEEKPVRNFVLILNGQHPELRDEVVIVNARYDASCVVPELAYGAEQAIGAALLVDLAEHLSLKKLDRTILLVWTGADSMNFASLRQFLGAGREAAHAWGVRTDKSRDFAINKELEALPKKKEALFKAATQIRQGMRNALNTAAAVRAHYELQIKQALVPISKRLIQVRRGVNNGTHTEAELDALRQDQKQYDALLVAVQRNSIEEKDWPEFEALTGKVMAQIEAELADTSDELETLEKDVKLLRPYLNRNKVVAFFAPDITSQGGAFGIYWQGAWRNDANFVMQSRLGQRLVGRRASRQMSEVAAKGFIADTLEGNRDWRSDVCAPVATAADVAQHFAYMSLVLVTAHDGRWQIDSPLDHGSQLNLANVERQVPAVLALVVRAASIRKLRQIFRHRYVRIHEINGQAVVPSPGDLRLNLGQPGKLVVVNTVFPIPRVVGTRWMSVKFTSATGKYAFPYLSRSWATKGIWWDWRLATWGGGYTVDVVGLDEQGRIVETANHGGTGLQVYQFKKAHPLHGVAEGVKSVLFDCEAQYISGLRDPRYLEDLREIRPLNQRTGDDPHYVASRQSDGLASVFLRPDRKWLMTASRGHRGIRMIMTAANEDQPMGAGFGFDQHNRSAFLSASSDFHRLNQHRLDNLAEHGITGPLSDQLQADSSDHLEKAKEAYEVDDDGAAALYHLRAAFGLQQVLYNHVLNTGDDAVLAIIFLLAVLLPFSFYTERLVINAATIYGRIGGFSAIFLVMMALLYSFHPAFRISVTPIAILLAFVIIVLSSVVVFILYLRFVEQLKRGVTSEHSTSLSRLSIISQAMLVGVANMRRRKIRTGFTLATLVVMTFALLSLSGTRTDISERQFGIGVEPSYPGVMVKHIGWRELPTWFVEELEASYGDDAIVGGQYWLSHVTNFHVRTTFTPYMLLRRADPGDQEHVRLGALMGVGPNEPQFLRLDATFKGLFERLIESTDGCLLPRSAAEKLGLAVGDRVNMRGHDFRVLGIYDDDAMGRLRYLMGQPYGPIDLWSKPLSDTGSRPTAEPKTAEQMLDPSGLQADLLLNSIPPHEFAIVNAQTARDMGAALRSVCIRSDDPEILDRIANDLSTQRLLPVYRARGDDVQIIASRARLSVVGLRDLLIPLLIGALIIMNTMINAVADQRSTIHTYSSLGLAPGHVGILFLSEAAALGTLGVVGGFILGQGFGAAVRTTGMLGALTLNYSSTAVILTMTLVMAIVLVSAIYPARMASRLAVPAESRRWELPAPDGNELKMELPFTVSEVTAQGACAFLRQWVALHSEAGVGVFISEDCRVYHRAAEELRGVEARLWLAPFDVGVSQQIRLEISPAQEGDQGTQFYQVAIRMLRLSGQQTAWLRSNRAFIAELRRQFLLWRSLRVERQQEYVEESQKLLAQSDEAV